MAEGWSEYVTGLDRLAKNRRSQPGIDAEMLGMIGMTSALVWSLVAAQRNSSEAAAQEETQRFQEEAQRFQRSSRSFWPRMVRL